MAQISSVSKTDQTVVIFDTFYDSTIKINANDYDVVYSFFYSLSNNSDIAGNFTTLLFRAAGQTGVSALTLMQSLQGKSDLELNATMAYLLNSLRSTQALYGVGQVPQPNFYVQRNVIQ